MEDLDKIRTNIDAIDDQMASLFARRMSLAGQIAQVKRRGGGQVLQRGREDAILARLCERSDPELRPALRQLYATLFGLSRTHQRTLLASDAASPLRAELAAATERGAQSFAETAVVACQGIAGAYAHLAAERLFLAPKAMFLRSFEAVFLAVEQGLCAFGVLPIENSTYGSVTRVYDLLKQHDCRIVRSLRMPIDHCLLSKAPSLKQVREIFSHEQAFGQCGDFLASHSDITVTVCENTAVAARLAAAPGNEHTAAISSEECAPLYDLNILRRRLQDQERNETRFICIAPQAIIPPGANRTSVLLSLPHRPGTLSALLQLPACLGVNLTKLETRPAPGREFEFLFYLDFASGANDPETVNLLEQMREISDEFTFLGSYREECV